MGTMTRRRFLQASTSVPAALCLPGISALKSPAVQHQSKLVDTSITHRYPSIPLLMDGKRLEDPEELAVYNNTPLYYTPLRQGGEDVLAAFTSRDQMLQASLASLEPICASYPYNLPTEARFYQHTYGGGAVLSLAAGYGYSDLTRVRMSFFSSWNDQISSLDWCRWNVTLFEHINYSGSQLLLRAGCTTVNLVSLGWNDRASSIANWGTRF